MVATVVVAGQDEHRHGHFGEQRAEDLVLACAVVVTEVALDDEDVGSPRHDLLQRGAQADNGMSARRVVVGAHTGPVAEARLADVEVGDGGDLAQRSVTGRRQRVHHVVGHLTVDRNDRSDVGRESFDDGGADRAVGEHVDAVTETDAERQLVMTRAEASPDELHGLGLDREHLDRWARRGRNRSPAGRRQEKACRNESASRSRSAALTR